MARVEGPVLIAEQCVIAQRAEVKGPTVLGPGCEVADGAAVEGSVLWHGSRVGNGAVLNNCIVGSHSYIQPGCHLLDGCVLGDNVTVETGFEVAKAARIEPGTCLRPRTNLP